MPFPAPEELSQLIENMGKLEIPGTLRWTGMEKYEPRQANIARFGRFALQLLKKARSSSNNPAKETRVG